VADDGVISAWVQLFASADNRLVLEYWTHDFEVTVQLSLGSFEGDFWMAA